MHILMGRYENLDTRGERGCTSTVHHSCLHVSDNCFQLLLFHLPTSLLPTFGKTPNGEKEKRKEGRDGREGGREGGKERERESHLTTDSKVHTI